MPQAKLLKFFRLLNYLSIGQLSKGLILSIFGAFLFANSAYAVSDQNKKFGNWLLHCSEVATPEKAAQSGNIAQDVCALFQSVAAENRPRFGLTVLISKDDGTTTISNKDAPKPAALIKILVPLGVLIPTGIGMNVDGIDLGLTGFLRCLPNGCTAVATLSDSLLAQLKLATTASFTVFLTPDDGLSIPIKLEGLAEGFNALK